jgi:excisionase family DNA binding protein
MKIDSLPRLLTQAETADYLGVTQLTVSRWRKAGKIGFYMVGKSPRFSEAHIAEYLGAQTVPAATAEPRPVRKLRGRRNEPQLNALAQAHAILKAARERRGG